LSIVRDYISDWSATAGCRFPCLNSSLRRATTRTFPITGRIIYGLSALVRSLVNSFALLLGVCCAANAELPPANKRPAEALASAGLFFDPNSLRCRFGYVRRLGPFRTLHDIKFDRISFLQRPVSIADDRRIVYEHVGAIFSPDESVSLRIIEPFNCSLHFVSPLAGDSGVSYSWGGSETNRRHEHELREVYQIGFWSQ
jgi:hypothetical protein